MRLIHGKLNTSIILRVDTHTLILQNQAHSEYIFKTIDHSDTNQVMWQLLLRKLISLAHIISFVFGDKSNDSQLQPSSME